MWLSVRLRTKWFWVRFQLQSEVSDVFSIFLYLHDIENLVRDKTCFKNPNNPSTIDHFWTNNYLAFQNPTTTYTGFSDSLKASFLRKKKELFYRDYKHISFSDFNDVSKTIFLGNNVG